MIVGMLRLCPHFSIGTVRRSNRMLGHVTERGKSTNREGVSAIPHRPVMSKTLHNHMSTRQHDGEFDELEWLVRHLVDLPKTPSEFLLESTNWRAVAPPPPRMTGDGMPKVRAFE